LGHLYLPTSLFRVGVENARAFTPNVM